MKILLINNFHYRKGGSETVYFNTADILRKAGHEVFCFSFVDEQSQCSAGDLLIPRPAGEFNQLISYFSNSEAARRLDAFLDEIHPDIAHLHLFWGGLSSSILPVLRKHNVPVVHTAHDYRLVCPAYTFVDGNGNVCERCKGGRYLCCAARRCSKGSFLNSLFMSLEMFYRQVFRNPCKYIDALIYVSEFSRNKHIEINPAFSGLKSTVLPNFTPDRIDVPSGRGEYFLYCGRLSTEKGLPALLKAFSQTPSLKLKIAGDGPLKRILLERAPENIVFVGYKSGQELKNLIKGASFVVVPSKWYENNPMSVIEAFAMSKPVIGSDIGGIPELVSESGAGFLFCPGDSDSLKEAVTKAAGLSDSEYNQLSRKALDFAARNFDSQSYFRRLVDFYKQVI